MNQPNTNWLSRLWDAVKKHAPFLEELVTVFPGLARFRVPLLILTPVVAIGIWQWDGISKLEPVAGALERISAKRLPQASLQRFSVAVAHIEADQNGDVEKLLLESLKGIKGIELLRFDRKSDILAADRPLDAETEANAEARAWLASGGADIVIWGYVLPTKEKTVRVFITPRLTDDKFEAKMSAEQSLEFPVKAGQALAGAVEAQVLAYLAQFDPGRDVAKDVKASIAKLSDLIEHWPAGRERAAMRVALANAYRDLAVQVGDVEYLKRAVSEYRAVLPEYAKEEDLVPRTQVRNFLGGALRTLGEEDVRYVREAVDVYQDSLREISRKETPAMWASVQSNLGIALHVIGLAEHNVDRLREAVEAQRSALTELSRDDDALNWALMKVSFANSLTSLGQATQEPAAFSEAIAAYEDALLELTRERYPFYWAMIKCDEGGAQMFLAKSRKDEKGLIAARQTFTESLQEYTREKAPVRFGMVNHNLGIIAYARYELSGEVPRLEEAVASFKLALQTRTAERSRVGWAETQYMMGFTLAELGYYSFNETALDEGERALRQAATVFDEANYPQHAKELKARIDGLPAQREFVRSVKPCLQEKEGMPHGPACQRFLDKHAATN